MAHKDLTGIILAGGNSNRIGAEKGLTLFRGKPLIEYPLAVLEQFCTCIIISTANYSYSRYGHTLQEDVYPVKAALNGIYSSLAASPAKNNIVVACDMPHVTVEAFRMLLREGEGYDMAVPVHPNGSIEPLCAYYSKRITGTLEEMIRRGSYRLQDLSLLPGCICLPVHAFPGPAPGKIFRNVNNPGDIEFNR